MSGARCILLAAGGTGGHLFPAAALAAALAKRGVEIELATDDRARKYGQDFPARAIHAFPSATTTGAGALSKAKAALILAEGVAIALAKLVRIKPRAVVGFGGYPTVPPLLAASFLRVPSVLHEQNAVMGRANRFLSPRVSMVACGFPQLKGLDAKTKAKTHYTGNPVRPEVIAAAATPYPELSGQRLQVLVTGGSQGARVMADVVPEALALLSADERQWIRLTQQARGEDKARVAAACARMNFPVEVAEFFADLPARIAAAHLVIARAGASTVSELAVIGRPSVLVPFPHALDQDQAANAATLAASGGAVVIPQTEFTPERVATILREALASPAKLAQSARAAKSAGVSDAAERLADLVLQVAQPAQNTPSPLGRRWRKAPDEGSAP
jgi:UDP-N-acetylglucosamine--N-acetylmuramyl-(pentapeptide) pyrophosphoryl-undecaprenol N-acetylglucosamine transferase